MVSKIVFVVLIGCALAFASHIERANNEIREKVGEASERTFFGPLIDMIIDFIRESPNYVSQEINERLNTPTFQEANAELQAVLKIIYGDHHESNVSEEKKTVLEAELHKVALAYKKLVREASNLIAHNSNEKLDATQFKQVVEHLKEVVKEIKVMLTKSSSTTKQTE